MPKLTRPASPQGLGLIQMHIDVGLAYTRVALNSRKNSQLVSRYRKFARESYDNAVKLMDGMQIAYKDAGSLENDLAFLRLRLIRLGETVEARNYM